MRRCVLSIVPLCMVVAASLLSTRVSAQMEEAMMDGFDCVIYPSLVADLGSSTPGVLENTPVDRGDRVREGEIVAELDSEVEKAALELARIRAESSVEVDLRGAGALFAERRRRRSEELRERQLVSKSDIDERETEARIGRIQVRQANENLDIARVELRRAEELLARRTIRSPFDGVVVERYRTIGELIENQPILRVARLDPLHVEVIVPVEEIGRLRVGLQAEVNVPEQPNVSWMAVVSRLDRVADVASGTYGVRLSLPNPDHDIPSGRRCRVRFPESAVPPDLLAAEGSTDSGSSVHARRAPAVAEDEAPPGPPLLGASVPAASGLAEPPGSELERLAPNVDQESRACHWIGPVADKVRASTLKKQLLAQDTRATLIERVNTEEGVQVVSTLQENRADAVALLTRLRAAGITDLYLAPSRSERRISLGIFPDTRSAERRLSSLREKGFEAELTPWRKSSTSYYLTARLGEGVLVPNLLDGESTQREPLRVWGADGTSREVRCEEIIAR